MGVLIYFIHHIAMSIQLPHVIASIAKDLSRAIDAESSDDRATLEAGPSVAELLRRMDDAGGTVAAPSSGYLQFIQHETLIGLAAEKGAVIRLLYRPGHFVVERPPARHGLASGSERWGEPRAASRAHHRPEPHPGSGSRVRG